MKLPEARGEWAPWGIGWPSTVAFLGPSSAVRLLVPSRVLLTRTSLLWMHPLILQPICMSNDVSSNAPI